MALLPHRQPPAKRILSPLMPPLKLPQMPAPAPDIALQPGAARATRKNTPAKVQRAQAQAQAIRQARVQVQAAPVVLVKVAAPQAKVQAAHPVAAPEPVLARAAGREWDRFQESRFRAAKTPLTPTTRPPLSPSRRKLPMA